jgi:DNA-binding transcriptional LysR family regulator
MSSKSLPPLDLLKGFEAVARHLSFTKASAELYLTQSAVSRQVRQLEEHLDVDLFVRRARGLELTRAGNTYVLEVRQALNRLREATASVAQERAVRTLTLTSSLSFASLWLVPQLSDFQKKHPDIRVHVVADNTMRNLENGEFDMAVRYCRAEQVPRGTKALFHEKLVPVCSPSLFPEGALHDVESLGNAVLLHFDSIDFKGAWLAWRAWFRAVAHRELAGSGALHFSHYEQVVRAAIEGHGVAVGRVPLMDRLLKSGELVRPLVDARYTVLPEEERAYWLVLPEGHPVRAETQLFVDWIGEAVSGLS